MSQFGLLASPQTDVLWAGGVLILLIVAIGFVLLYVRKVWDPRQAKDEAAGELTLEQLEAMHQAGHISNEEFSLLRRRLLKIPSGKEESKSQNLPSDSIMDDSEDIRTPGQDDADRAGRL